MSSPDSDAVPEDVGTHSAEGSAEDDEDVADDARWQRFFLGGESEVSSDSVLTRSHCGHMNADDEVPCCALRKNIQDKCASCTCEFRLAHCSRHACKSCNLSANCIRHWWLQCRHPRPRFLSSSNQVAHKLKKRRAFSAEDLGSMASKVTICKDTQETRACQKPSVVTKRMYLQGFLTNACLAAFASRCLATSLLPS
jgi:hypothetical protein